MGFIWSLFDVTLVIAYLLIFIVAWMIFTTLRYNKPNRKRKKLPGPAPLPLIGSVLEIANVGRTCKNDNEFCRKLCNRYGPVMEFKVGVQNFVVVEDFDVARQIFNSEDWCSRVPSTPMYLEYFARHRKVGILLNDGEEYKETRRFTLRCLKEFGFGQLQNMGDIIQEEVEYFILNLEKEHLLTIDDNNNNNNLITNAAATNENNNNGFTDISLHFKFNLPSLNVLWKYLCGGRFECDDPFMSRIVSTIQRASESVSYMSNPMYAFPFLRFIPGLTEQQLLVETFNEMRSIFQEVIDAKRKLATYKNIQNDFIDMFLKSIDDSNQSPESNDKTSQIYTEEQLIQCCVDMALAGSDTTGNSIEYSVLYMLQFPEAQAKVQEEIDSVIGCQRRPTIHDRNKMPYTEATIHEILRCGNVAAFDYRTAMRNTELCGAQIPKGSMVLLNIAQMHNDQKIWTDPENFRPSRFLNDDLEIINANKLYAFGGGKRLCIGKSMAKATLFIFFTTMLQRYTFVPSKKYPNFSIHSYTGGFTTRPDEFYCTIKPRHTIT